MLAISICSEIPKHRPRFNKYVRKYSTTPPPFSHTNTHTLTHIACWLLHLYFPIHHWNDNLNFVSFGLQNEIGMTQRITSNSLFAFYHFYRFVIRSQGPILNSNKIWTNRSNQCCNEYKVIVIRFMIRHAWIELGLV